MQIPRKLLQTSIATGFTVISLLLLFVFSDISIAQTSTGPKALRYQYDALGRLTFTEDSVNSNRDFDYDAAGNRLFVATGTATDESAAPSVPAAPTGLISKGPFSPTGGYHMTWNSVPSAIRYEVKIRGGTPFTTTNTYADSPGPAPEWVRAINTVGAGPQAYF
jgi:YD repeat-containing protein